jgi:hypothetical protein
VKHGNVIRGAQIGHLMMGYDIMRVLIDLESGSSGNAPFYLSYCNIDFNMQPIVKSDG